MDLYKMKFKMAFRWRKVKSFFKLCEYNFRKKFNLEGDDQFYYHLQRQLLRDIIRTSAEHEYLEEHGLLPEEPEPEPEPEKELGLVRELPFGYLYMTQVHVKDTLYMLTEVKEYEDHVCLKVMKTEDWEPKEQTFCLPHQAGERYVDFGLDGLKMRFDGETLTMCLIEAE